MDVPFPVEFSCVLAVPIGSFGDLHVNGWPASATCFDGEWVPIWFPTTYPGPRKDLPDPEKHVEVLPITRF